MLDLPKVSVTGGAPPIREAPGYAAGRREVSRDLLEQLFEPVLQVIGGDVALRVIGNGLFAQMIEGEGSGRREPPPAGLLQHQPREVQSHLGVAFRVLYLLHG
jgi:hypothetical protein